MEFDGIQMTLIAIFLVSAVAMVVVCDFLRKTFFRPAPQHHPRGHRRHGHSNAGGPATQTTHGLSEFAKRSALPVSAQLIAAEPNPEPLEKPVLSEPQVASTLSPLPEHPVDAHLWEVTEGRDAATTAPRGLLDQEAWQQATASRESFTGVAFSVSVNDADGSMWHSPGLMRAVSLDITGLLGENDFGCRTAYDEFFIVCPQEHNRQRRLKQITTQLWECQLRGQRARSVRFIWGGVEVRNRPLAEALAVAAERMRESRRMSESIAAVSSTAISGVAVPRKAAAGSASCKPRRRAV